MEREFSDLEKLSKVIKQIKREPKVGIVTVTYYSSEDIRAMVKSLQKLSYGNFQWFLIDHSEDEREIHNLKHELSAFKFKQFFIFPRENLGFGAGVNFGVTKAIQSGCEYIWILNPDVEVEQNTLVELLKTLFYFDVPVVTCKIRDFNKRNNVQYDGEKVSYSSFSDYPQKISKVKFLSGANIFLKAEVFENIRFSEEFFLFFEDNDFFKKLLDSGIWPIYTPYTSIYHKGSGEELLSSPIKVYYFYRNSIIFRKNVLGYVPSKVFAEIFDVYNSVYFNKKLLCALIKAVYDGVLNLSGKREVIYKPNSLDKKKFYREYFQYRDSDKLLSLERGRDYLFLRPRDREFFLKFLKDAEEFVNLR